MFAFFTPKILLSYTKNFAFYTKNFAFLHQFFLIWNLENDFLENKLV